MATPPAGIPSRDLARIRQVLARELETINEYEQLAREAESEPIRAFFLHLAEEEKEHVAEAVFLIGNLDGAQRAQFEKDFTSAHFGGAPTVAAEAPSTPTQQPGAQTKYLPETYKLPREPGRVIHALPAPPSPSAGRFTVGPLKGGQD